MKMIWLSFHDVILNTLREIGVPYIRTTTCKTFMPKKHAKECLTISRSTNSTVLSRKKSMDTAAIAFCYSSLML